MRKMSQEKILRKLKSRNTYIWEYSDLINNYFLNGYDLNKLFKLLDNPRLYRELYEEIIFRAHRIRRYQDIYDMKKVNINDEKVKRIIVEILAYCPEDSYVCDMVSFFKLYDKDTLRHLGIRILVELYKREKNNNVFECILEKIEGTHEFRGISTRSSIIAFNNLGIYISYERKCILLDIIIDKISETEEIDLKIELKCVKRDLSPYNFEFIRMRSLTNVNKYGHVINAFLINTVLDAEKREKHIDEIIKRKYTKVIYNLLWSPDFTGTNEEIDKLKKALENIKDEYYFYYLVRTNIEKLLSIFNSYLGIKTFMESTNGMFNDKEEFQNIIEYLRNLEKKQIGETNLGFFADKDETKEMGNPKKIGNKSGNPNT